MIAYILSQQPGVLIRSDHYSRWYATLKFVTEGRSIYDPRNGEEIVSLNSNPTAPIEGSFFYPAHLLILTLPLVGFTYPVAHSIWLFLIQVFNITGLYLIARQVRWPGSANSIAVLLFLSILFIPNIQNTIWGQFNTVGVISLALVMISLRLGRMGLAGLLALGLTFKPQNMLLTLVFLIVWAISERKRWSFLISLAGICFGAWLFAEWLEPDWVSSFIKGVQAYSAYLHPEGVLGQFWRGGAGLLNVALVLVSLWVFYKNRQHGADSAFFNLCIAFSLGMGWLILPLYGMMQLVALPLAAVLLLAALKDTRPLLYKITWISFLTVYVLGILGFIYGLSRPENYGLHVQFSEFAYKTLGPILLTLLSGWAMGMNQPLSLRRYN